MSANFKSRQTVENAPTGVPIRVASAASPNKDRVRPGSQKAADGYLVSGGTANSVESSRTPASTSKGGPPSQAQGFSTDSVTPPVPAIAVSKVTGSAVGLNDSAHYGLSLILSGIFVAVVLAFGALAVRRG